MAAGCAMAGSAIGAKLIYIAGNFLTDLRKPEPEAKNSVILMILILFLETWKENRPFRYLTKWTMYLRTGYLKNWNKESGYERI